MARRRTHPIAFKRQIAEDYLSGEVSLHALAKRHDICRNLIRVWVEKHERGEFDDEVEAAKVNRKRVARLMRLHGRQVRPYRRYVATTDSDHDSPIFPTLAKHMAPGRPDQLWIADITDVAIVTGFVYLAVILDAWSHRVVGDALGRTIEARLTLAALEVAITTRPPPKGCVHHSDRGSQREFKRSSQHFDRGGCDGHAKATFGIVADGARCGRQADPLWRGDCRSRMPCTRLSASSRVAGTGTVRKMPVRRSRRPTAGERRDVAPFLRDAATACRALVGGTDDRVARRDAVACFPVRFVGWAARAGCRVTLSCPALGCPGSRGGACCGQGGRGH